MLISALFLWWKFVGSFQLDNPILFLFTIFKVKNLKFLWFEIFVIFSYISKQIYKLQLHQKDPKRSPLRDIDFLLWIDRTRFYICQNGALMLWTILYYKILFQWLICKFSSVILKLIVTRDIRLVLHEYLKFKKDFFVFYIDFYFGFLLVIGVYKFQTKISKVPMVRFLIFFSKI